MTQQDWKQHFRKVKRLKFEKILLGQTDQNIILANLDLCDFGKMEILANGNLPVDNPKMNISTIQMDK